MGICGICLKCGDSNMEYGAIFIEDNYVNAPYRCLDCGFSGVEIYELNYKETRSEGYDSI